MSKPKGKSRLNVQEFQTWLQGIMEFQSDEWAPNAQQWAAIYDKIMNLKTDETVSTSNISASSMRKIEELVESSVRDNLQNLNFNAAPAGGAANNPPHRPQHAPQPNLMESPPPQEQPENPSGLSPGQELISAEEFPQLTPEQIQDKIREATEGKAPSAVGGNKIQTPNVDTSDGSYNSNFL